MDPLETIDRLYQIIALCDTILKIENYHKRIVVMEKKPNENEVTFEYKLISGKGVTIFLGKFLFPVF